MAKQLSEAFHNLEKANQTLEAKVLERTKELSAKNGELERTLGKLRSAQERMVAQARMASLGQLTKGVAHEIKNPLNFVNNFASLSKELCNELQDVLHESSNVPEPLKVEADSLLEMMRDNLNRIESHGRRADLIISGMLEHSRTVTGHEIRETDLNHAIRTSVEVAARMVRIPVINGEEESGVLDPEQLFRLRLAPEVGFVQAYPGELCRAMINVFSNAIWAVGKLQGGLQRDPVIEVTSERNPAGEVVITVRDNGIGMDEETRRQAVVPFFTTKPPSEGTGLGLSLAYDIIVQLHKGAFEMQSEPGSGTIVRMTLPEAQSLS
jgi:signal transduction histidine kinase